jgi:hypothetical protein
MRQPVARSLQWRTLTNHRYCVYGIVVLSDTPLALPEYAHDGLGEVECLSAPASVFLTAIQGAALDRESDSWYRYAVLDDGSTYVRWDAIGEFLVAADGRRITCRRLDQSPSESFQVYMLGQALSFALVRQRFEPLHATVVVDDDQAVAFLGDNAFGKSSLAACFLAAGARLLTDDLLVLHESSGRVLAYPGPPRIKLFPKMARRFLGDVATGVRQRAEAAYKDAKRTREVAQIAATGYDEGRYRQELHTIESELTLAEYEKSRAEEGLVRSRRIREKGLLFLTSDERSWRLALEKALAGFGAQPAAIHIKNTAAAVIFDTVALVPQVFTVTGHGEFFEHWWGNCLTRDTRTSGITGAASTADQGRLAVAREQQAV